MKSVLLSPWLRATVLVLLAAGIALGLLQLAGGLISVRSYRLASRSIVDQALADLADLLRAELGLRRRVELRESDRLATAATIGWFKPVILLPPDWRNWTTDQRRAVLAHELAHVVRGDYLACVLAQLSLAIHFYHPLVHWLAARLRLEQELAADATAAELAGGRRNYLQSLAELALHTSERPLGWPAHTFLPTQGTFLRRIEMLRDSKPVTAMPRPRGALRWSAIVVLLLGAALVAGLRGGANLSPFDKEAAAQEKAGGDAAAEGAPLDLTYVTNDAKMLLAVRPSQLLSREEIRGALAEATQSGPPLLKLLSAKELSQITLVGPPGVEADDWNDQSIVILQFSQPVNVSELAVAGELKLTEVGQTPSAAPDELCYSKPNERTVIMGKLPGLTNYLANRRKGKPLIASGEGWEKVSQGALVAAIDMQAMREEIGKHGPPRGEMPPELGAVSPLWKDTEFLAAGIILEGQQVHVRAVATCHDGQLAENVADTAKAAFTLARNAMRNSRERTKDMPAFITLFMDTTEGLLKTVKVEQSQTLVIAQTSTDIPAVKSAASASLLKAISQARGSAQRMASANNLKQIAIAMHNWADTYGGKFPPPVIYGKDGKGTVPHSWRVELLPYLEQAELYEQYQFDEPWDSEANKKVLAKMPAIFRHPSEGEKTTSSSYYVFRPERLVADPPAPVGAVATAFSKQTGVRFADIIDGTSNTIAIIEAKSDIPWTKPEDILFDPEKDPPGIDSYSKEGFQAAFCDGAVKFISNKVEPRILKLLIMPQDGNPIPELK